MCTSLPFYISFLVRCTFRSFVHILPVVFSLQSGKSLYNLKIYIYVHTYICNFLPIFGLSYYFYAMPFQFSSVAQSCLTLCDPVDCRTPGLPVHHQLPEFTQTHVHWVGNAIDYLILCHPLLLLPSIFPSIRVFSSEPCLLENIIWIDEAQLLISFIIHIFYPILDIFAKSKVFKIFLLCFLPEMLMVLICI